MYYSEYQQPYTHLLSVSNLAKLVSDKPAKTVVIIDASIPMPGEKRDCYAEFKDKHIPGAKFLNLMECKEADTDNAYMLPSKEKFVECVEALGVTSSSMVVVYDANEKKGMFSSPRCWYMFRFFNHKEVYVLNGGLKQWIAEGNDVETGEAVLPSTPSKYVISTVNTDLVKSLDEVQENITSKKFQLVDARSPGRFNGTAPEPRPDIKPGHVPGAKCLFWTQFLQDGLYKSPEQLAEVFKSAGVDPKGSLVATCGTGVTACFIALSSYILGNYNVPVYDGAWFDWYLHAPEDLKENVPKDGQ